jgi:integrase
LRLYLLTNGQHQYRYRANGKEVRRVIPSNLDPIAFCYQKNAFFAAGQFDLPMRGSGPTLNKLIGMYYAHLREQVHAFERNHKYIKGFRPEREQRIRSEVERHILPFFGNIPIKEITEVDVAEFQESLATKMLPQSVNPIIGVLSKIMKFFVKTRIDGRRVREGNPCRDVDPLPTVERKRGYTPTTAEVEATLAEIDDLQGDCMFRLAAEAGLRFSEIAGLTWTSISDCTVKITQSVVKGQRNNKPKSKAAERVVPIDTSLNAKLAELRLKSGGDAVFRNGWGKLCQPSSAARKVLQPAQRRAGVKAFGWHGLRRWYRNYQEAQGVPLAHIQKLMGHEIGSTVTDRHYTVVRQDEVMQHRVRVG